MKSFKIGLLGPAFTYSDLAIQSNKFADFLKTKQTGKNYSAKFFISITDIIEALKKKQIDFALVPIENSTYGTVRETEDAIFKNESNIIFAFSLEIHHALLTKKETKAENIKKIYAHQQALEQCEKFLRKYFRNAQKIGMGSSGQALEYVANEEGKWSAAIGPEIAAKKYKLKIIEKNIENEKQNRTMFLILGIINDKKNYNNRIPFRTSIAFWFDSDRPGSLYEVLREFAKAKLNLTKIESRPASKKLEEYIFFLDFDGNEKEKKVKKVLQKLKKITGGFKSFGSYQVY